MHSRASVVITVPVQYHYQYGPCAADPVHCTRDLCIEVSTVTLL